MGDFIIHLNLQDHRSSSPLLGSLLEVLQESVELFRSVDYRD